LQLFSKFLVKIVISTFLAKKQNIAESFTENFCNFFELKYFTKTATLVAV